jgi:DNA polymerase-3 subunit alpha
MDTYAKKLSIQLNIKDLQEERISVLQDLFRMHSGEKILNFVVYDNAEKIKLNMPSRKQKIKISQELLDELTHHNVMYKLN